MLVSLCFFYGAGRAVVLCFSGSFQRIFRYVHINGNSNTIVTHGEHVGAGPRAQAAANAAIINKILH